MKKREKTGPAIHKNSKQGTLTSESGDSRDPGPQQTTRTSRWGDNDYEMAVNMGEVTKILEIEAFIRSDHLNSTATTFDPSHG